MKQITQTEGLDGFRGRWIFILTALIFGALLLTLAGCRMPTGVTIVKPEQVTDCISIGKVRNNEDHERSIEDATASMLAYAHERGANYVVLEQYSYERHGADTTNVKVVAHAYYCDKKPT